MMGPVYIGLCLTAQNVTAVTTAQFSNVTATGGATGAWQVADIGIDHPGNDPARSTSPSRTAPTSPSR